MFEVFTWLEQNIWSCYSVCPEEDHTAHHSGSSKFHFMKFCTRKLLKCWGIDINFGLGLVSPTGPSSKQNHSSHTLSLTDFFFYKVGVDLFDCNGKCNGLVLTDYFSNCPEVTILQSSKAVITFIKSTFVRHVVSM